MRVTATLSILLAASVSVSGNASTCGPDKPSPVKDCEKVDMGSCGNACCTVDIGVTDAPVDAYAKIKKYLEGGGTDGSYNYNTGPNEAGLNPGDDLRQAGIPWQFIFQGAHTTTKGYVDHINMYVKESGNASLIRLNNIPLIHGALGDNGQSYKSLKYMVDDVFPSTDLNIRYGCGQDNV